MDVCLSTDKQRHKTKKRKMLCRFPVHDKRKLQVEASSLFLEEGYCENREKTQFAVFIIIGNIVVQIQRSPH